MCLIHWPSSLYDDDLSGLVSLIGSDCLISTSATLSPVSVGHFRKCFRRWSRRLKILVGQTCTGRLARRTAVCVEFARDGNSVQSGRRFFAHTTRYSLSVLVVLFSQMASQYFIYIALKSNNCPKCYLITK